MSTKKSIILIAITLIAITGCRSHKQLQRGAVAASDSTAIADKRETSEPKPIMLDTILNSTYRYYTTNFSCTVRGVSVNGQIRMVSDSIIWISVSKVVELGRAIATPTGVKGYSKLMNKYYDGSYADLRTRWGIDADFATIEALLTGNCLPRCTKSKEPVREGDTVTLWYRQNGEVQRQVTLKKAFGTKRLTSTETYTAANGQRLRMKYGKRQNIGGQTLPTEIEIMLKSKKMDANTTVKLEKTTLGQRQSFPFSIPKKAEKM